MTVRWVWVFLDLPWDDFARAVQFWSGVTGHRVSAFRGDLDQFATLLPARGDAWVKVQRVGGAGGVHVDLDVDVPLDQARAWAVSLGATVVDEVLVDDGALGVVVCRSPGGFAFCLTRWQPGRTARGQVREGVSCVLDQVCLDIPRQPYAAELDFWSALTGWPARQGGRPEFSRIDGPTGTPVRFLLQRLDEDLGEVHGHVDLACADVPAEVRRQVALGATEAGTGAGWVVMRDPTGLSYCCTSRDPLTGGRSAR